MSKQDIVKVAIILNFVIQLFLLLRSADFYADYTTRPKGYSTDLLQYMTAARIIKTHGVGEVYNLSLQGQIQRDFIADFPEGRVLSFRSLPITALLFVPLVDLPPRTAFLIAFTIKTLFLVLTLLMFSKLFRVNSLSFWTIVSFLPFSFLPLKQDFLMSQLTVPVLFFATSAIYLVHKNHDILAGILLTGVLIKPQYGIILLLLLVFGLYERKIKFCVTACIGTLAFIATNVLLYGTQLIPDYIAYTRITENIIFGTDNSVNYNFASFFQAESPIKFPVVTTLLATYLISTIVLMKRSRTRKAITLISISAAPLFFLHTMPYDPTLLILLIFMLPALEVGFKNYYKVISAFILFNSPLLGFWDLQPLVVVLALSVVLFWITLVYKDKATLLYA